MSWWPCGGCGGTPGDPVCTCLGNVDLITSGITAEQCTVGDVTGTFASIAVTSDSGSISPVGSYKCQDLSTFNDLHLPLRTYDHDGASCSTSTTINGASIYVDNSDKIWVSITCEWQRVEGFSTRTWLYTYWFESDSATSAYNIGDTVTFTYDSLVKDGSNGGSYGDPGQSNMPFDASSATVTMVLNGCCWACQDSTPEQMSVVLAGVVNATGCADCADINGTYVLNQTTDGSDCSWELCDDTDPDINCGATSIDSLRITLVISQSLGTYYTTVTFTAYGNDTCDGSVQGSFVFQNSTSDPDINCEFSSTGVTLSTFSSQPCDWSSATCTVTAL